jgi:replication factor A1
MEVADIVMLNRREIINKILTSRPDLSENELQRIIQEKRDNSGDFLTEEGATYMVANELGLDLSSGKVVTTDLKIKDLIVGANDITVMGQVIAVTPIRLFKRRDNSEGSVARLVITDETGTIAVVLWDEQTKILSQKRVSPNQVLKIAHGYVRVGLDGTPELNVGRRGHISVNSSSLTATTEIQANRFTKIRELRIGDPYVNLVGAVKGFSRVSTFTRANGLQGQVMRVRLADETGRVKAVFWDDQVSLVKAYHKDDVIKVQGGQVRSGLGNTLEVHVGRFGSVKLVTGSKLVERISSRFTTIKDVKNGLNDIDVLGRVLSIGQIREFQRRNGQTGIVGSLFLMDESGSIRVTLWDDSTVMLSQMSVNDILLIEGGNTREGIGGRPELNVGSLGEVTINPPGVQGERLPQALTGTVNIGDLKVGMQNVIVEGRLIEEPIIRNITTRDGEDLRVASLRISDSSGDVDVSLWRDLVDKVVSTNKGASIKITNAYIKPGFYGDLEISSGSGTDVEILESTNASTDLQSLIDDLFSKDHAN